MSYKVVFKYFKDSLITKIVVTAMRINWCYQEKVASPPTLASEVLPEVEQSQRPETELGGHEAVRPMPFLPSVAPTCCPGITPGRHQNVV
jgi:hypothetical protein